MALKRDADYTRLNIRFNSVKSELPIKIQPSVPTIPGQIGMDEQGRPLAFINGDLVILTGSGVIIAPDSSEIPYDNVTSGLSAINAQDAIDELADIKVDKVVGQGLSQENYTAAEKTKLSGIQSGAQVNNITSVNGQQGVVVLAKGDIGLSNVDNTSDTTKNSATVALHNKTIDGGTF